MVVDGCTEAVCYFTSLRLQVGYTGLIIEVSNEKSLIGFINVIIYDV